MKYPVSTPTSTVPPLCTTCVEDEMDKPPMYYSKILEKNRVNTQRVFTATKDRQQRKFLKLVQEKQASVSRTSHVDQALQVD